MDAVCRDLSRLGFIVWPVKASGRRGQRRQNLRFGAGDILAISDTANLLVEVGGPKKVIGRSLVELRTNLPPGFIPIVARCVARRWVYATCEGRFKDLADLVRYHTGPYTPRSFDSKGPRSDAKPFGAVLVREAV